MFVKQTLFFVLSASLIACNVYEPFNNKDETDAFLEAALACEHEGDLDCAIENYLLLPDEETKNRQLCISYLVRAGLTLRTYANVLSVEMDHTIGMTAEQFLPWTEEKSADVRRAMSSCGLISGKLGSVLQAIALMEECLLLIAKTDTWVASSLTDTACNTGGNQDLRITVGDIESTTMMCPADVLLCRDNLSQTDIFNSIENNDIKVIYDDLPADLKNSQVGIELLLVALKSVVAEDAR